MKVSLRRGSDLLEFRFIGENASADVFYFPRFFVRLMTHGIYVGFTKDPFNEIKLFVEEGWVIR